MTPIYHITHVSNLSRILAEGCLWCKAESDRRGCEAQNIGYAHIKARRGNRAIPITPGGVLNDYVPFYFCVRSPMLFAINGGNVPGYDGGQESIIYLASYAEDVAKAGLDYVFTNKHAVLTLANFYNDLADLGSVDLALMKARYWNNTEDDPDRLERRQAEFLVKGSFPLNLVVQIGVGSRTILERVEAEIAESNYPIQVQRRQNWYY